MAAACAAICCAPVAAASLQIHKADAPSSLTPLAMAIGGRVLTTPSPMAKGFGGNDYEYQWPGVSFRAAFKGARVFFRVGKSHQILHVVVDGKAAEPLVKPDPGVYEVDGLSEGPHTIALYVATESQSGPNTFSGFAVTGHERPLMAPRRRKQIEFIGDSHTVGYGDLSHRHQCSADEIWAETDDTAAFGAMTAGRYDADYQVNAISGRGVVRNYNGYKADTLPEAYPYVLLDHNQVYDDAAWKPQVVVVALGTNDFSTPLNPGEQWKSRAELRADYEATYMHFIERLRAKNPEAYLIVWATDFAQGEVEAEAQKVVQEARRRGDRHISFLPIDGLKFEACDFHPSLADEAVISQKLMQLIDADQPDWAKRQAQ